MTETIVLGAGMVGICTALALQARGQVSVVIDRNEPGKETSFGNAGIIQAEAVEPYSLPRNPLTLLALAAGQNNAVRLHWRSMPTQLTALFAYWSASSPKLLHRISPLWAGLISEALDRHSSLIDAADARALIVRDGYWEAHSTDARLASATVTAERFKQHYGVNFRVVDKSTLAREEPALRSGMAGAIHWLDPWRCLDPGELVAAYTRLYESRGGRIVRGDANSLTKVGRQWKVAGESASRVVVALGPWSPRFLRLFGYRIPMVHKRGYHLHYRGEHGLKRSMLITDHSVVLSPMNQGLRIATAAEFSSSHPLAYPPQLARGELAARKLLDFSGAIEKQAWWGTRPCLPRMLPLVCEAPRHEGMWFHFGHGHQGFTLGPVTAERLVSAICGDQEAIAGLEFDA